MSLMVLGKFRGDLMISSNERRINELKDQIKFDVNLKKVIDNKVYINHIYDFPVFDGFGDPVSLEEKIERVGFSYTPRIFYSKEDAIASEDWSNLEKAIKKLEGEKALDCRIYDAGNPSLAVNFKGNLYFSMTVKEIPINNTIPVWVGCNRKGVWKASANKYDLEKFDKLFIGGVNSIFNHKIYGIKIYYGYDYNYGGKPAIFDVVNVIPRVFHSVTEAKKDSAWKEREELAKNKPLEYVVSDFGIASKDEWDGGEFLYGDVMEGRFNMRIFPIRVITD